MSINLKTLASQLGAPYLDEIDPALFDPALIAALPVTWARERAVLPVRCVYLPEKIRHRKKLIILI